MKRFCLFLLLMLGSITPTLADEDFWLKERDVIKSKINFDELNRKYTIAWGAPQFASSAARLEPVWGIAQTVFLMKEHDDSSALYIDGGRLVKYWIFWLRYTKKSDSFTIMDVREVSNPNPNYEVEASKSTSKSVRIKPGLRGNTIDYEFAEVGVPDSRLADYDTATIKKLLGAIRLNDPKKARKLLSSILTESEKVAILKTAKNIPKYKAVYMDGDNMYWCGNRFIYTYVIEVDSKNRYVCALANGTVEVLTPAFVKGKSMLGNFDCHPTRQSAIYKRTK